MPSGILFTGNCVDVLRELPEKSVHCCITSPPYWGLRDYTVCSCIKDGIASADCIKCSGTGRITGSYHVWGGNALCQHTWVQETVAGKSGGPSDKQKSNAGSWFSSSTCSTCSAWYGSLGNEPTPELFIRHLVLVFRGVRRALRDDGTLWVNIGDSYAGGGRGGNPSESAHRKQATNYGSVTGVTKQKWPVPEGVKPKDLVGVPWMLAFALRADDWYLRQDIIWHKKNPMPESVTDRCVKGHEYVFLLSKSKDYYFDYLAIREPAVEYGKGKRIVSLGKKSLSKGQATGANVNASGNALKDEVTLKPLRNKRSVWTMSSQPFKGAHFATFPESLILPPIIAGCPIGGTVLDPFSGAATTGLVSLKNGRNYYGVEQNPDYQAIAEKRLTDAGLECVVV